jgi:outer membrane immunogenic protein
LEAILKNLLLGAAALVAVAGPAFAADLPLKAVAPPAPVYNWTGFYIGGNLGGAFASSTLTGFAGSPGTAVFFANNEFPTVLAPGAGGLIGGGQVGYNWQVSPLWVVGLEADGQYSGYKGNSTVFPAPTGGFVPFTTTVEQHSDWYGTFRGRAGILATPSVLLYGTGGVAYGQTEASFSTVATGFAFPCPGGLSCAAGSNAGTHVGWTAGVGFEIMSIPHWIFRVEYLYMDLGTQSVTGASASAPPITFTTTNPFKENILRVALSYKL